MRSLSLQISRIFVFHDILTFLAKQAACIRFGVFCLLCSFANQNSFQRSHRKSRFACAFMPSHRNQGLMDSFSVLESQCGIDTSGLKTRPLERRPKRLSELSPFFTAMSKKGGAHCCYGRSPSGVRIGFGIEILFLQSQLQFFCAELSVIRFGLSNLYIKAKDPFLLRGHIWQYFVV